MNINIILQKINRVFLGLFILIISLTIFFNVKPAYCGNSPSVNADTALVMDASTGIVLFEKNPHQKRSIASLTKVMTAIVAAEEIDNWDGYALATKSACSAGESEIYLSPGERILLKDLLFSILLKSANDAAVSLSEAVAGRKALFISLMNRKASELGMQNTQFKNPHGLDQKGHYSTAYDCALMARYALKFPVLKEAFRTKEKVIPWQGRNYGRLLVNHNKLLFKYPYIKGMKTGYTNGAGNCLIAYAELGEKKIISVVLGAQSSQECYKTSLELINYGASLIEKRTFFLKGETVASNIYVKGEKYDAIAAENIEAFVPTSADLTISTVLFPDGKTDALLGFSKIYADKQLIDVNFVEGKPVDEKTSILKSIFKTLQSII